MMSVVTRVGVFIYILEKCYRYTRGCMHRVRGSLLVDLYACLNISN